MGSVNRLMRMLYFAPHPSHNIVPMQWSRSILHAHESFLPQKGQSKI